MKIFMFHGMDIFQFFVWFFIYSFLGWGMECIVIRRQKGTGRTGDLPSCRFV